MKLRLAAILILVAVAAGAVIVAVGGLPASAAGQTKYLTSPAVVGNVTDQVVASGTVTATATYGLAFGTPAHVILGSSTGAGSSTTTWPVLEVKTQVGASVKKGDVLATADTTQLKSQLANAANELSAANINLTVADEDYTAATTTDTKRQTKVALYNARVQAAQARTTYDDLAKQVAEAKLTAPIDGVVTAVNIQPGIDAPSGDAITIDAATFAVSADVVESDVGSIAIGQPADVTVSALGGDIQGTVASISPTATTSSGSTSTTSYAVAIALADPPAKLRAGMDADVTITIASATNVLSIPSAALRGQQGAYTVSVLDPTSGAVTVRTVDVGLITNTRAEIRSGLQQGDQVITGTAAERNSTTVQNGGGFGLPGGGFNGGGFRGGGTGGQNRGTTP